MKIIIDIPKEFEIDYKNDRFDDCFSRIYYAAIHSKTNIAGNYDLETLEMLRRAFREVNGDWENNMNITLKPCPFCGKVIDEKKELYIPERDWKPSFYDPDSGGDPIYITCKCGLEFSTGTYEWEEFVKAWNTRQ